MVTYLLTLKNKRDDGKNCAIITAADSATALARFNAMLHLDNDELVEFADDGSDVGTSCTIEALPTECLIEGSVLVNGALDRGGSGYSWE